MKRNTHKKIPQVAVLLDSCYESSRGMLRGVFEYVRLYGPWGLNIVTGGTHDQKIPDFRLWKGSGLIANVYNRKMAQEIAAVRLPTVIFDLNDEWQRAWYAKSNACQVQCDSTATGKLAAEHFLEKGFAHFAFVGGNRLRRLNWSSLRREAFVKRLADDGFSCEVYPDPAPAQRKWVLEQKQMIRWLRMLPKPVALFAANDARARQVLDACLAAGIRVPYEAAVLSVDNDPLICETCIPSLSSIRMDIEGAGYAAAELLDKRMFGEHNIEKETVTYPPLEIVSRLSTQTIHVNEKLVIDAREFIRINAGLTIRVSDVAKHVKISPRWLEKRFDGVLGRSVIDEIKRVRMETVLRLVTQTKEPFDQISRKCGFASVNRLRTIFREEMGQPMSAFRTLHGSPDKPLHRG